MRNRNAFTLIELLVVVSIIAVLAGLLLPALSMAREKGRASLCLSNLKQIGTAVTMYGEDHGFYPYGLNPARSNEWDFIIGRYLGSGTSPYSGVDRSPVYACPSAKKRNTWRRLNYSANPNVCSDWDGPVPPRYAAIERSVDVILAGDALQFDPDGDSHAVFWGVLNNAGTQIKLNTGNVNNADLTIGLGNDNDLTYAVNSASGSNFRYRHAGSAQLIFIDGHAGILTKGKIRERHLYTRY